jgi:L,D-transpeptidase YcbB
MPCLPIRPLICALLALLLAAGVGLAARAQEESTPSLHDLLVGQGRLSLDGRQPNRAALFAVYQAHDFAPLWVSDPEREAVLLRALGGAADHGLDGAVFAVRETRPGPRDLLLSDAFLRYATALARGRVAASDIEADWAFSEPPFDAGAVFERALSGDVATVLAALAPTEPGYRQLEQALARYRRIAAGGGWQPVPEGAKLKLYDRSGAVLALRRRLAAEGYLPADALAGGFDRSVEASVRRFQAQHGIAADGEVGADTRRALNVPAAARVEQIRANLERWRELPRNWPKTRLEVNVPGATLTAFEGGETRLVMRAIVGAEDHPTPVMRAHVTAVLFNPAWTIPASIVKNEILPKAKHDPKYLERNHYVYRGAVLQQLPGAGNALGRVKFEMPNIYDVYLHDTPSRPLFRRASRSLSHGCVRLENPRELALYLLSGSSDWAEEDIDRVIAAGQTQRVPLPHSLPVYLVYWSAFVDGEGAVEFRDDVYARDLRLVAALALRDKDEGATPASGPDQTASDCCHSD